jgi:four helix bundle protein
VALDGAAVVAARRHAPCYSARMPKINRFQDLVAWQLAMDLADLVDAMISSGRASNNPGFCDQIQRSSSKIAAQIAEGFARFRATESAYYYRIARASLAETQTHLLRGYRRHYWSDEEFKKAWEVSEGALKTTSGLLRSRLEQIEKEEAEKAPKKKNAARREVP